MTLTRGDLPGRARESQMPMARTRSRQASNVAAPKQLAAEPAAGHLLILGCSDRKCAARASFRPLTYTTAGSPRGT